MIDDVRVLDGKRGVELTLEGHYGLRAFDDDKGRTWIQVREGGRWSEPQPGREFVRLHLTDQPEDGSVSVVIPDRSDGEQETRETDGVLWLSAYPELLGWPRDVVWLFAPVGEDPRPFGDLWGMDEAGDLVIVNAKRPKSGTGHCDPFDGFLDLPASAREQWKYRRILADWEVHWAEERVRLLNPDPLATGKRALHGVLPGGRRRSAWGAWRDLYAQVTAQLDDTYDSKVRQYLKARAARRNPEPYVVGVIVVTDPRCEPRLSTRGAEHMSLISNRRRRGRVLLRSIQIVREKGKAIVISESIEDKGSSSNHVSR